MKVVLTTAYWPNLSYFFYVINSSETLIEQYENFQKQSFRTRTRILSANGPLNLVIPTIQQHSKTLTKDTRISYSEKWQINHWRAITSAYRNSPYFEYFEDDLRIFYQEKTDNLVQYNYKQLQVLFKILKIKKEVSFTESYEKDAVDFSDLREKIHPKKILNEPEIIQVIKKPYYQTFGEKHGFVQNLSMLDLICNTGLEAKTYFI